MRNFCCPATLKIQSARFGICFLLLWWHPNQKMCGWLQFGFEVWSAEWRKCPQMLARLPHLRDQCREFRYWTLQNVLRDLQVLTIHSQKRRREPQQRQVGRCFHGYGWLFQRLWWRNCSRRGIIYTKRYNDGVRQPIYTIIAGATGLSPLGDDERNLIEAEKYPCKKLKSILRKEKSLRLSSHEPWDGINVAQVFSFSRCHSRNRHFRRDKSCD